MTLSQDEVYKIYLSYLPHYFEDGQPLALQLSELFYSASKDSYMIPGCKGVKADQAEHYCLCGHARTELFISADGRWLPCMPFSGKDGLVEQFPKVSEVPLKNAMEQSFYISCIDKRLSEYLNHNDECRKCPYCFECAAGCRGRAATSEDYMAKDYAICTMFNGGYIAQLEDMMNKIGIKKLS
jgi:radical SAM protein with 4Fe4S-binding SPASM domain